MAQDAAPSLQPLTISASAPGAGPSLEDLTISAGAPGGAPSLVALTSTGAGSAGGEAHSGVNDRLAPMTATGTATGSGVATGDAELEPPTAEAYGPTSGSPELEALTSTGECIAGGEAHAAMELRPMEAAAAGVATGVATGAPELRALEASATSEVTFVIAGVATLSAPTGTAAASGGSVASADVDLQPLEIAAAVVFLGTATGSPSFLSMVSTGRSTTGSATYRTWVMNAANRALTEYTNFDFNSYAEAGGLYYAAGADGVYRLDGADDDGEAIPWTFATGFLEGEDRIRMAQKRLDEVLLAIRYNGPLRIRVWTDDETYYDYTVANYREDMLQQVRARTGRGLQSRFFKVEVSGMDNATAEVRSMTVPLRPTARRLG